MTGHSDQPGADAPFTEDDERQMLGAIERWLEREVRPQVQGLEHADAYPRALVEQMREFGLFGATIAPEYGGLGMPTLTYARIVARMSEVWMSLSGVFSSHPMGSPSTPGGRVLQRARRLRGDRLLLWPTETSSALAWQSFTARRTG